MNAVSSPKKLGFMTEMITEILGTKDKRPRNLGDPNGI